jgi:hypothetical protein
MAPSVAPQEPAEPVAWMTQEAMYRLKNYGGNGSRGTVPAHAERSKVATIPLYTQSVAYAQDAGRIWDLLAKLETYHKDGQCMFGVFGFPGFFETGDSAIDAAMALDVTKRDPKGD